ncbi:MAG: SAM-dependent methyltransferase [Pseudomonadota bacterium]
MAEPADDSGWSVVAVAYPGKVKHMMIPPWLLQEWPVGTSRSVASYMETCLWHQHHGYYNRNAVLGRYGDFITSPEISQLFGEVLAIWAISQWHSLEKPNPCQLIELGPGRASLMLDMLRTFRIAPDFQAALDIWLVEKSPTLTREQQVRLQGSCQAHWVQALDDVPQGAAIVIANEFFDALPVQQFVHHQGAWHERIVLHEPYGVLCFAVGERIDGFDPLCDKPAADGDILERCPQASRIAGQLGMRTTHHPGAGILVDYGYQEAGFGDTLQGVRDHGYHSVLGDAGSVDLSAHVHFGALGDALTRAGAELAGILDQGAFLLRFGLGLRAARLMSGKTEAEQETIKQAMQRLTASDQMGHLFKCLIYQTPS